MYILNLEHSAVEGFELPKFREKGIRAMPKEGGSPRGKLKQAWLGKDWERYSDQLGRREPEVVGPGGERVGVG